MRHLLLLVAAVLSAIAQEHPLAQLIEAARTSSPSLNELVTKYLGPRGGTAVWGQYFLFITESANGPATVSIDGQPPAPMSQIERTNHWFSFRKCERA